MNLQIRNPRARELAQKLADKRGVSLTEAVIEALEAQLEEDHKVPLAVFAAQLAEKLRAEGGPGGRDMTMDEIDQMWGHD